MALAAAFMLAALLVNLGAALAMVTMTDARIAAVHGDGVEAFYAAEAAIDRVLPDLFATRDWDAVLGGGVRSTFVDGAPAGIRDLDAGLRVDLAEATHRARCGRPAGCTESQMDAVTDVRPWGANNPRWQLYAFGPVASLLPGDEIASRAYVVVWAGDDGAEVDGDPLRDGMPGRPGHGVLTLRAEAFGPGRAHRTLEATFARADAALRAVAWRELR